MFNMRWFSTGKSNDDSSGTTGRTSAGRGKVVQAWKAYFQPLAITQNLFAGRTVNRQGLSIDEGPAIAGVVGQGLPVQHQAAFECAPRSDAGAEVDGAAAHV